MKSLVLKIIFFLSLITITNAFAVTMNSCEQLDDSKLTKCLQEIIASSTWEPMKSNLVLALKKSNNNINIKFDPKLDRAAITKVETENNRFNPVIVLGKNADANELLITLNHELVHYVSTFDRLAYVFDGVKIGKCLTKYQLLTLQDEGIAFQAELTFWNNSPADFKEHFKNVFFNSKVFQKKVNYEEFYKMLEASISQDKKFMLKKYIEIGESLPCAKNII